jgi:signal transduction histidine kinase
VASRGDTVAIEVEDNAGGLDARVADHLFEPFVTGKPKGIGLGLSMTRRAMESQRGTATYEPVPGGSRFVLSLPSAVQPASHAPALTLSSGVTP